MMDELQVRCVLRDGSDLILSTLFVIGPRDQLLCSLSHLYQWDHVIH